MDDWIKIIGAIVAGTTSILGAIGALYLSLRGYRRSVNGRMSDLLELTRTSSHAEGRLEGRERRQHATPGNWNE